MEVSEDPQVCRTFESPLGRLAVRADPRAVFRVRLEGGSEKDQDGPPEARELCRQAQEEIEAFLAGHLREFTVPIDARGTPFHRAVWRAMCEIPYGETLAYGELAAKIGQPGATQAVGNACGANPIPLIIPCHRVLAAGGRLGGFSGGLDRKRWLLGLERGQGYLF